MEPIRPPFYVGLVLLGTGILLMLIWWITGEPAPGLARLLHGLLLFGFGSLFLTLGVFLSISLGLVFLVSRLAQPHIRKSA